MFSFLKKKNSLRTRKLTVKNYCLYKEIVYAELHLDQGASGIKKEYLYRNTAQLIVRVVEWFNQDDTLVCDYGEVSGMVFEVERPLEDAFLMLADWADDEENGELVGELGFYGGEIVPGLIRTVSARNGWVALSSMKVLGTILHIDDVYRIVKKKNHLLIPFLVRCVRHQRDVLVVKYALGLMRKFAERGEDCSWLLVREFALGPIILSRESKVDVIRREGKRVFLELMNNNVVPKMLVDEFNDKNTPILKQMVLYTAYQNGTEVDLTLKKRVSTDPSENLLAIIFLQKQLSPKKIAQMNEFELLQFLPILCYLVREEQKLLASRKDIPFKRYIKKSWIYSVEALLHKINRHPRLATSCYFYEKIGYGLLNPDMNTNEDRLAISYVSTNLLALEDLFHALNRTRTESILDPFEIEDIIDPFSPEGSEIYIVDQQTVEKHSNFSYFKDAKVVTLGKRMINTTEYYPKRFLYFFSLNVQVEFSVQCIYLLLNEIWENSRILKFCSPEIYLHKMLPIDHESTLVGIIEDYIPGNHLIEELDLNSDTFKQLVGVYLARYILSITVGKGMFLSDRKPALFKCKDYFNSDNVFKVRDTLAEYLNENVLEEEFVGGEKSGVVYNTWALFRVTFIEGLLSVRKYGTAFTSTIANIFSEEADVRCTVEEVLSNNLMLSEPDTSIVEAMNNYFDEVLPLENCSCSETISEIGDLKSCSTCYSEQESTTTNNDIIAWTEEECQSDVDISNSESLYSETLLI
eukprot:TRINITY_DN6291_c0_g1_i1.p1 TRINITY_DN6291_c0_g1~~TRINITY_DN6291_c0_g1_i1.p1  ORF type:complete len:762 (-),score=128.02 TRINITY_DN6291_c0_g1_i1:67-2316(-)